MVLRIPVDGEPSAVPVAVPVEGVPDSGSLDSISCYSATACAGIGTYEDGEGGRAMMIEIDRAQVGDERCGRHRVIRGR